jgi:hypothetical protein
MKWIFGAIIVGFAAAVVSGRIPVTWLINSFSIVFIVVAFALSFAYSRSKHMGLLLMGSSYGVAAGLSLFLNEWWPLAGGYAAVWAMRAMGLEPAPEGAPVESSATGEPAQIVPADTDKEVRR